MALWYTAVHCGTLWWVSSGSVEDELTGRQAAPLAPIGCRSGHLAPLALHQLGQLYPGPGSTLTTTYGNREITVNISLIWESHISYLIKRRYLYWFERTFQRITLSYRTLTDLICPMRLCNTFAVNNVINNFQCYQCYNRILDNCSASAKLQYPKR